MIDWAGGGAPSGLPEVTTEDNDKVLMVVNGKLPTAWYPAPEDMADLIDNTVELFYERNNGSSTGRDKR